MQQRSCLLVRHAALHPIRPPRVHDLTTTYNQLPANSRTNFEDDIDAVGYDHTTLTVLSIFDVYLVKFFLVLDIVFRFCFEIVVNAWTTYTYKPYISTIL